MAKVQFIWFNVAFVINLGESHVCECVNNIVWNWAKNTTSPKHSHKLAHHMTYRIDFAALLLRSVFQNRNWRRRAIQFFYTEICIFSRKTVPTGNKQTKIFFFSWKFWILTTKRNQILCCELFKPLKHCEECSNWRQTAVKVTAVCLLSHCRKFNDIL